MFIAGAKLLESKKKYVDELNVFPVPDGDTGTNMTLTILAAAKEVQNVDENSMSQVAKAISSGSLRGARGNSGVILSQLFRGFAKEISEFEVLDGSILAHALQKGVETAYKAVMKPKEGTILTVARAVADKATQMCEETDDLLISFRETIKYAEEILDKTPDMLPVLKEAGVVDAGGQGLIYILRGAYRVLENNGEIDFDFEIEAPEPEVQLKNLGHTGEITFGYCTEFIITTKPGLAVEKETYDLRDFLETIGDSIVAVSDEEVIKIHVHTNDPGKALQRALTLGELINIKIDNMREQHSNNLFASQENVAKPQIRKEHGF
ncbi:MAG: DAK2 domain-containing protein, partial [Vallitaleaceae bacterium]|nr:DAK2 domain-containing protein [Vallitaleaceae bacterium]